MAAPTISDLLLAHEPEHVTISAVEAFAAALKACDDEEIRCCEHAEHFNRSMYAACACTARIIRRNILEAAIAKGVVIPDACI